MNAKTSMLLFSQPPMQIHSGTASLFRFFYAKPHPVAKAGGNGEGEFYTLTEAYANGYITPDELKEIAEKHVHF